jgi:hypothetical protein
MLSRFIQLTFRFFFPIQQKFVGPVGKTGKTSNFGDFSTIRRIRKSVLKLFKKMLRDKLLHFEMHYDLNISIDYRFTPKTTQ